MSGTFLGLRLVVSFVPEILYLMSEEEKGQVLTRSSESSVLALRDVGFLWY